MVIITDPAFIGILNNICNAIAPPKISAKEVDILANIAEPNIGTDKGRRIYFVVASARQSPVTIPKCATLC